MRNRMTQRVLCVAAGVVLVAWGWAEGQEEGAEAQPGRRVVRMRIAIEPAPPVAPSPPTAVRRVRIEGGYAVVVSRETAAEEAWAKVVAILKQKYSATVIEVEQSITEAKAKLSDLMPRYTCIVARPTALGRAMVVETHRLMRQLDDDPYTDTIWGIVTGYTADDAVRIASHCDDLVVRRGLGTTGFNLKLFDAGLVISDGKPGQVTAQGEGAAITPAQGEEADRAQVFVEALHKLQPDMLITSSHATERDLQMPFGHGELRCREGKLFGMNRKLGKGWQIASPNPKIHMGVGNCLLGHVDGDEAIALALMHSAGVHQLVGYVVNTWYGAGGWGINRWFFGQDGRFSLAEAWYINNQTLVQRLLRDFPQSKDFGNDQWDMVRDRQLLGKIAAKLGYRNGDGTEAKVVRENLGLVWDVDTVALYGDPAWRAHLPQPKQGGAHEQRVITRGRQVTLVVSVTETRDVGMVFAFLPQRIDASSVEILEGGDAEPLITDNFILVKVPGELTRARPWRLRFTAAPAARPARRGGR